jgi:hypothetical protein
MDSLYHQKYHRHNHHTEVGLDELNTDASLDPIASYAEPFQGDFVLSGCLFSQGLSAISQNIGINLSSGYIALSTTGQGIFDSIVYASSISIAQTTTINIPNTIKRCSENNLLLKINNKIRNIRVWGAEDVMPETPFSYTLPGVYDVFTKTYLNQFKGNATEYLINVTPTGTRPIEFQWFLNSEQLVDETNSFIRAVSEGSYTLRMVNRLGVEIFSDEIYIPFDEDVITTNKDHEIISNNNEELVTDYTFIIAASNTFITSNTGDYILT